MNYFIIGEEYRTAVIGIGGVPKFSTSFFPIGEPRESKNQPVTAYHFSSYLEAQKYLDEHKPEKRIWKIFFIQNDDYANF